MARVLVVDDERGIRVTFEAFLSGEGHEVKTAATVDEAKEKLLAMPFDVVVTDMILPRVSGMELLSFLHAHDPSIQILVVTGEPTMESVVQAMRLGAFDYRSKPVSGKELCNAVADAARKKEEIDTTRRTLRESREQLRLMAENVADVIWMTDRDFNLTFVTPSVEAFLAMRSEDCLGKPLSCLIRDEGLARVREALKGQSASADPAVLDLDCLNAGDRSRDAETTARPLWGDGGEIAGYLGVLRDISERRRMERGMRESERQFRSVVENSLQGILILQGDPPRLVFVNEALAAMYGGTVEELTAMSGEHFLDLIHQDDRTAFVERYHNRLQGWTSKRSTALRFFRKDGSLIWMEAFSGRIDYQGSPAIQASVVDITQRKTAEEQLLRYSKIMQTTTDGVVVLGLDGRIIDANRAICEAYGVANKQEMLGKNAIDLFIPEERAAAFARIDLLKREGALQNQVYHLVSRRGETIPFEVNSSLIHDAAGTPVAFAAIMRNISARIETERRLSANEERFRKVFAMNPMAMSIVSLKDGRLLEINDAFVSQTGFTRSELMALSLVDLKGNVPSDDRLDLYRTLMSRERVHQKRMVFHRKNGEEVIGLVSAELMTLDGRPCAIFAVNDITDRERAQDALREREHQYRLLSENISDIIWTANLQMVQTYVSPSVEAIIGYAPDELLVKPIHFIYDEPSKEAIARILEEELSLENDPGADPNRYRQVELRAFRKDGKPLHMEINARFMRDEYGHVTGIVGVSRDVTTRRQAEERLRDSQRRFKQLAEAMFLGLLIHQGEHIVEANEAACRITGYSRDELLALNVPDILAPESRERVRERIRHAEEGRNVAVGLRKDHERYWLESYSRQVDFDGRSVRVSTFWDITEERKTVEDAKRMQKQLLHWQKMEAVGQLAGSLAHDYNNLLTGIIGNIELALLELAPGNAVRRYLEDSRESVRHAVRLTRQLQEFGRGQTLRRKPLSPSTLLDDMKRMLARVLGENVTLLVESCDEDGLILADGEQLEQLFFNVALNAKEAMPEGGAVTIRARREPWSATPLAESTKGENADDAFVWFWDISDTGCGMSDEVRAHAFEPFYTTKSPGNGTGLGLAMVYGVVRRHDGHVELASERGKGTTVRIWLPCMKETAQESSIKPKPLDASAGRESILVVEDEQTVRQVVAKMLARRGYRVTVAEDARQALERLERDGLEVDLLVTDVLLPGLNGRELAEYLGEKRPGLRVIYMSGYTDEVFGQESVLDPALHFIAKPFEPSALLALVQTVLHDGSAEPKGEP